MKEKLFDIIKLQPCKYFWVYNKKIIVNEYGQRYKITSISIDEDNICIINYIANDGFFVSSSEIDCLSKQFIAQILVELV